MLRLLGYDAAIYASISFDNMIRLANKERRIILTRSHKQASSSQKFSRIHIKSESRKEQITEIIDFITMNKNLLFTRCLKCNRSLNSLNKEKIKDLVPSYIYETHNEFKICRKCGKVFWHGTHYTDMLNILNEIFISRSRRHNGLC